MAVTPKVLTVVEVARLCARLEGRRCTPRQVAYLLGAGGGAAWRPGAGPLRAGAGGPGPGPPPPHPRRAPRLRRPRRPLRPPRPASQDRRRLTDGRARGADLSAKRPGAGLEGGRGRVA